MDRINEEEFREEAVRYREDRGASWQDVWSLTDITDMKDRHGRETRS